MGVDPDRHMAEELMSDFYGVPVSLKNFQKGRTMSFYQICCLKHMDSVEDGIKEAEAVESDIEFKRSIAVVPKGRKKIDHKLSSPKVLEV